MKKQYVIIGLITILVTVGLSGCNELIGESSLSPSEVRNHPEKYFGKNITVHGIYVSVWGAAHLIAPLDYKSNKNANTESIVAELEAGMECFDGGEYYFTGTLKKQAYTNLPMLVVKYVDTEYVKRVTNNEQTNEDQTPTQDEDQAPSQDDEQKNLTIYPTDDTSIRMREPDNNYGDSVTIDVRNREGSNTQGYIWMHDLLIKFVLSSLSSIDIKSAVLYLYYLDWEFTPPSELTLYRITSDWNEKTVTFNTQPTYASKHTTKVELPKSTGVWITLDVTTDVKDFVNGSKINYGWQIVDECYYGSNDLPLIKFYSKEYANNSPYIRIVYSNTVEP